MIFRKVLFISIIFFFIPLYAAGPDDEIIKNLDFFQNMELLKDENPYVHQLKMTKEKKISESALELENALDEEM